MYRGHGDDAFSLIPKALRPHERLSLFSLARLEMPSDLKNISQLNAESRIIERFIRQCDEYGLVVPGYGHTLNQTLITNTLWIRTGAEASCNWPHDPIIPAMCLAQHHGLPTRLLDWSYSGFKAAHFAATDALTHGTRKLSLWALRVPALSRMRPISVAQGHNRVDVINPPRCDNAYLHAQEGLFTLCRVHAFADDDVVDNRPLDQQIKGFDHSPPYELKDLPVFYHLVLPTSEAVACLRGLEQESITAATLFPDYNGVVRSIKDLVTITSPASKTLNNNSLKRSERQKTGNGRRGHWEKGT